MIAFLVALLANVAWGQTLEMSNTALPFGTAIGFVEVAPGTRVRMEATVLALAPTSLGNALVARGFPCIDRKRSFLLLRSLGSVEVRTIKLIDDGFGCQLSSQAVIPANMPLGLAEAVLVDESNHRYGPLAIRVVPFDFNVIGERPAFAASPAIASRIEAGRKTRLGLVTPAVPGTVVSLTGSGLGQARIDQITMDIGGVTVRARAARPALEEGFDEVEFVVPAGLLRWGCYVPASLRIADRESNTFTLPLMPVAGPCKHRLGLSAKQMEILDGGGTVPVGVLTTDAHASFRRSTSLEIALLAGVDRVAAPQCAVSRLSPVIPRFVFASPLPPTRGPEYLDAGEQLRLIGPNRSLILARPPFSDEYGPLQEAPSPPQFDAVVWRLEADGSPSMHRFQWEFRIPPLWEPANLDVLRTLRRGENPVLRWDGTRYEESEEVTLTFLLPGAVLTCQTKATAGVMRVDTAALLQAIGELPAEPIDASVTLEVGRSEPLPYVFPLKLVDGSEGIGIFQGTFVTYQQFPVHVFGAFVRPLRSTSACLGASAALR